MEFNKVEQIPIKNIYYMLSYAFRILRENGYKKMLTEHFENTADLFAEILIRGVSAQVKRGLRKEYISETETMSCPKGRIEIAESIKTQSMVNRKLVCSHDEFLPDSYMNRILKTTMTLLLKGNIAKSRKKELRRLLDYFDEVELLDRHHINWRLSYNKSNQSYQMLISVCCLVIKGLLHTNDAGSAKLADYLDEQRMGHLYEKFILEYYKTEYKGTGLRAESKKIKWQLDDENSDMLPDMISDIWLKCGDDILIMDAKYYGQIMQKQFEKQSLRSAHLYQVFTYVKNEDYCCRMDNPAFEGKVSGMLMYAKTVDSFVEKQEYKMSGNRISVRTLDLNLEFSEIKQQLDSVVEEYFGIEGQN